MASGFVRARHPGLGVEVDVPAKAFPAHARSGWVRVDASTDVVDVPSPEGDINPPDIPEEDEDK